MNTQRVLHNIQNVPNALPWATEKETTFFLLSLARMVEAKSILEIGTYMGFTTIHLAEILPREGKIITIDHTDFFSPFYKKLSKDIRMKIEFFRMSSYKALSKMDLNKTFDFIYIDGSHSFEHCYQDTILSLLHCKDKTIICFHDALSPDYRGIRHVIQIVSATNMLFFNQLFDISYYETPKHKSGSSSGLAVLTVKKRYVSMRLFLHHLYSMLGKLMNLDI